MKAFMMMTRRRIMMMVSSEVGVDEVKIGVGRERVWKLTAH